jgi:hypothetical protein
MIVVIKHEEADLGSKERTSCDESKGIRPHTENVDSWLPRVEKYYLG